MQISRKSEINAPSDVVWNELRRFMHIDEICPAVASVDPLTEGEIGVGSTRRNNFVQGGSMVEEVTHWTENKGYRVRCSDLAPPLRDLAGDISVAPLSPTRSVVTWTLDFGVKYGPLGWILGQAMMKPFMAKTVDSNLATLVKKVEST